jgi:hypothetical protein
MSPSTNAADSTGPKTEQGKQRASLNAVAHGLTGNRMLLQAHEQEAYARLTVAFNTELNPATESERQFVQKIIDCHTRLNRIASMESNILNFGLVENTSDTTHPDDVECMAAQTRSWLAHDTSFEKLGRYEARLARQLLQYTKEFERLQQARQAVEQAAEQADAESRYFENRRAHRNPAQPIPAEPLSPELASFCKAHPTLRAAFESYDPKIFDRTPPLPEAA